MGRVPLLLVHRDESLVETLPKLLAENGFVVDLAFERENTDKDVYNSKYQVIIVDPHDPLLGGATMLQQWRRDGVKAHIMAISHDQRVDSKVQCFDLGADDYLTLPLEREELLARLRVVLRRATADESKRANSIIRTHDLVINTISGRVQRGDQRIELTPREFALLRLLAIRKGRVVSRSIIWDYLYDRNTTQSSNVVDVYIRRLRVKIDNDFKPPLIMTRFGRGYMLRDDQD